jgi:hypothetical protein
MIGHTASVSNVGHQVPALPALEQNRICEIWSAGQDRSHHYMVNDAFAESVAGHRFNYSCARIDAPDSVIDKLSNVDAFL